jgi:hypothetical protein
MEIKDRVALLDMLLSLNDQAGVPESEVAGLVDLLAGLPDAEREGILEYIQQGDRPELLKRFAKIAKMEKGERDKILKAMGIQVGGYRSFIKEFFGSTQESTNVAKEVVSGLADVRKSFQEGFLNPLAELFDFRKKTK